MRPLIFVFLGILGFIVVIEFLRAERKRRNSKNVDEKPFLSASEDEPSETGRFRVQQLMTKSDKTAAKSLYKTVFNERHEASDDDEPLQDPFGDDEI